MYVANYYIGRDYTPGEIVPDTLPAETLKRLLDAGAIREVKPAPITVPITMRTDIPPIPPEAEETVPEAEEEEADEDEEEAFEEAEAPEIDVMDGLVSAEPAETPKRKTAAKGGRRK